MNTTKVIFTNSRNATAETVLYQYDYGQLLIIEGLDLPNPFSVDFGADGASSTLTMLGNDGQVSIPDELLETGKSLVAYIFLHEGEDDGETEYRIRIPVVSRPTRTDIEPTPAQQSLIDQLLAEMNDAVDSAEIAQAGAEAAQQAIEDMTVSAQTLSAGSDATVTKTEVGGVVNLDFGIPQGAQGETGATPNFAIGTVQTLQPNQSATASITGTAEQPRLNLGIPKGDTGEVGVSVENDYLVFA